MPAVHPRLCGEHLPPRGKFSLCRGSSPPVRGTLRGHVADQNGKRFIPACAGNTTPTATCSTRPPVHPRLCGEHCLPQSVPLFLPGSSPPVRGTPSAKHQAAQSCRFIPACAGNTEAVLIRRQLCPVHPRLCGEHRFLCRHLYRAAGSSPPVRGTHEAKHGRDSGSRFIPACAGNTGMPAYRVRAVPVHPRLCGEHTATLTDCLIVVGSSPPVRGTLVKPAANAAKSRFIPACAGNTSASPKFMLNPPVHPRLCGEHSHTSRAATASSGSSPPVRGTLQAPGRSGCRQRFIPACAGNTRPYHRHAPRIPVHPRLCGEHQGVSRMAFSIHGSSPPVRGTLK